MTIEEKLFQRCVDLSKEMGEWRYRALEAEASSAYWSELANQHEITIETMKEIQDDLEIRLAATQLAKSVNDRELEILKDPEAVAKWETAMESAGEQADTGELIDFDSDDEYKPDRSARVLSLLLNGNSDPTEEISFGLQVTCAVCGQESCEEHHSDTVSEDEPLRDTKPQTRGCKCSCLCHSHPDQKVFCYCDNQ